MTALPTGPRGRTLALALLLLAVLLLWFGTIAPLRALYAERADTLARYEMLVRHMESLAAAEPALSRLAQAQTGEAAPIPALEGASDGVAAAALQQKLNEFATAAGLHIDSAETLPPEASGNWHAIAVRVTLTGPWGALTRLLLAIAQSDTPMVVDDLQLRGPPGTMQPNAPDARWPVDASLTVTAWREAGA